ncbi:MAG: phytanoyl-CoA dioxygenase family protein [Proteobacteria bacterium]|nr:phytanoyl-CoA dioxygenase family protein [Pseudomonadota bacterium]
MADQEKPFRRLSADELQRFADDGVICVRDALPALWLRRIEAGIDNAYSKPSSIGDIVSMKDRGFMGDLFMWMRDDNFRSVVFDSPLAGLAHQVLGSERVTHWYDQLFVKEPGAEVPTPWHHDLTFWPVSGRQIVSIWIPLDPVTRSSSGLEYVRGSHKWPNRYKAITPDFNAYMVNPELEDLPDIDAHRSDYDLLDWNMQPGDALVFDPLIIHGSSGNTSTTTRRRALASRWAGDDVVYNPRKHTMPLPGDHGLEPGDPLGGSMFPTVIPAAG